MRVIAGTHGGRRLKAPDTDDTRPVTDRVKESVFSSLGEMIDGARVLDLFAGAGSFGIEALSRGAASAVFVERGARALSALSDNLRVLNLEAVVERSTVERYLERCNGVFDLVFCDPPWPLGREDLEAILERLAARLTPSAMVVVTRRATDPVPDPAGFRIDDERRHGDTRIIRYEPEDTT